MCLLPQHLVYGTPFLKVVYDYLGLAVGLARIRACAFMCILRLSLY